MVSGRGLATRLCRFVLIPLCLAIMLSGCARLPVSGPDAARLTTTFVTRLDAVNLFAAAPGGKQIAFSAEGVRVMPLPTGESRSLSTETPLALTWSPDGRMLAVASESGAGSRITVFGADGAAVAETAAAGRVASLFWTAADDLLAVAMELESFKFGATCREVLLRWRLTGEPERSVLHETTLKPYTMKKSAPALLARVLSPALSPLGDELLYGRIQDPPAFDAYLRIMIRNLTSGAEREIAKVGFNNGVARFSADGEELIMSNDSGTINRIGAWSGAEKLSAPFPGRVLAVSPDGRHLLGDGRLLNDGREVAVFPAGTSGEFLDDGRLLVADNGLLFLVSGFGYPVTGQTVSPERRERLRTLRAWRSSGLISAEDYAASREKVVK